MKLYLLLLTTVLSQALQAQTVHTGKYHHFTGTIGKYPVTVYLFHTDSAVKGSYYYNNIQEPIDINGHVTGQHMTLSNYYNEEESMEVMEGELTGSSFEGTWTKGNKSLPFQLIRTNTSTLPGFHYYWTAGRADNAAKKEDYEPAELGYSESCIWPSQGWATGQLLYMQNLLKLMLTGNSNSRQTVQQILQDNCQDFLHPDSSETVETFEESNAIRIIHQQTDLLSLAKFNWVHHGGAHGLYGTSYFTVDLVNRDFINLTDITDTALYNTQLEALLLKHFIRKYIKGSYSSPEDILISNRIPVTDNIFLTGKGIGFNYVPYEIAPYAAGEIVIFIPYNELKPYLKPGFIKRMKL